MLHFFLYLFLLCFGKEFAPATSMCQMPKLSYPKMLGQHMCQETPEETPLNTLLGERTEMCRGTWGNGQETLHLAAQLGSDILKRLRSAKMIFLSQETFSAQRQKLFNYFNKKKRNNFIKALGFL